LIEDVSLHPIGQSRVAKWVGKQERKGMDERRFCPIKEVPPSQLIQQMVSSGTYIRLWYIHQVMTRPAEIMLKGQ
jgi:hypothetical protein